MSIGIRHALGTNHQCLAASLLDAQSNRLLLMLAAFQLWLLLNHRFGHWCASTIKQAHYINIEPMEPDLNEKPIALINDLHEAAHRQDHQFITRTLS